MNTDSMGLKFAVAILLVGLAMAGFFAMVTVFRRRFPGGFFGAVPAFRSHGFLGQGRNRRDRIRIVEAVQVDPRRRAILIRRDNTEHLILVGGPTDVVIETGIDAPFEAAEPEEDYGYQDSMQESYEPEPVRAPRPRSEAARPMERPVERAAPPAYREWEDEDEDPQVASGQYLRPRASQQPYPAEPPLTTGIRPVTLARGIRPASLSAPGSAVDQEEAAIARELEAARRRSQQQASPQPAPPALRGGNDDFDDILAREMEERLEAAKRQARALAAEQRRPITPSRPAVPDQRGMQAGINRIFGDAGNDS